MRAPEVTFPCWILIAAATLASGCGSSDSPGGSAESAVRDSAGVRIVFNAVAADFETCDPADAPTLTIGSSGDDDGELLYQVNDAATLPNGRIAVVHGSTDEVRVYDADGAYETSMGRSGDGPGEFNNARGIFVRPDGEMWVGDMSPFRFNVFSPAFEFSRTVSPHPSFVMPPMEQGLLDDGRSIMGLWRFAPTPEFEPDSVRIHMYDASGERVDTIGVFEYGSMGTVATDMSPIWMGGVFESRTRVTTAGKRIAIGYSGAPEVRLFGPDMALRGIVRWEPVRDRRVTSDDIEQYHDDIRERYADAEDQDAQSQDFMRQQLSSERPVSEYFPAFNRIEFGKDERLWVQMYNRPADTTDTWMIFSADGRYECTSTMSSDFYVYEAGADYVLGRTRDPVSGIELVHVYDIEVAE